MDDLGHSGPEEGPSVLRSSDALAARKARPILFSAPMVRALLAGTKTQTRRIVKPQPSIDAMDAGVITSGDPASNGLWWWLDSRDIIDAGIVGDEFRCPYGAPGDLLWVREAFSYETLDVDRDRFMEPWFWADGNPTYGDFTKPKPSIHMPRIYNRLTLEITDVRVERLQDISEADALAEGIERLRYPEIGAWGWPQKRYQEVWEKINGPGAWDANPWVWAVSFAVHRQNVDTMPPVQQALSGGRPGLAESRSEPQNPNDHND